MDETVMFFLAGILIIGGVVLALVTMRRGGAHQLDVDRYRSQWMTIEQSLRRDEATSCQLAVMNADKLVDLALKERGFGGETMGERLKQAQSSLSNVNAVWASHKLRNQLAHETNVTVGYDQARHALVGFKQALKDLGAI